MKPRITFARWGNYTIAFKTLFEQLGIEVVLPNKTNSETITEGAKISPEMFCFPLKVTLGNYISALKKGANTVFMIQNVGGSCRQRYYGSIQEKVLRENGWKVNFIDVKAVPRDLFTEIKKLSGASSFRVFKAAGFFFRQLGLIEKAERLAHYYRPREVEKGITDRALEAALVKIEAMDKERNFSKLKKEILKTFSNIIIERNRDIPKVAIIGEIYTVSDPSINFEIEKKLGHEEIDVHREMDITYQVKKGIFPWKDWIIQRKIMPYLQSTVGGHGRDAIYEMLNYIKKDFDGIIHLLPFSCMPEVTVRPILERIHQESGIPFLSLSLDEQIAEAGINTRLEAFVDVVKNRHNAMKNKSAAVIAASGVK